MGVAVWKTWHEPRRSSRHSPGWDVPGGTSPVKFVRTSPSFDVLFVNLVKTGGGEVRSNEKSFYNPLANPVRQPLAKPCEPLLFMAILWLNAAAPAEKESKENNIVTRTP